MDAIELVVLALAVARLTRLLTTDTVPFGALRSRLLFRYPTVATVYTDSEVKADGKDTFGYQVGTAYGRQVFKSGDSWYAVTPYRWTELITCNWCMGLWVGIIVWVAYWFYPDTVIYAVPFALSQIAGMTND